VLGFAVLFRSSFFQYPLPPSFVCAGRSFFFCCRPLPTLRTRSLANQYRHSFRPLAATLEQERIEREENPRRSKHEKEVPNTTMLSYALSAVDTDKKKAPTKEESRGSKKKRKERKREQKCLSRESNPRLGHGKSVFYRYTTKA
jgi:hypothetical protein